ncbi:MAG: DUF2147 domain-containing protein [Acidobacteria bacterium]|nr:DUF2147 domain-containing protein [Acidobacteriota bacterium]
MRFSLILSLAFYLGFFLTMSSGLRTSTAKEALPSNLSSPIGKWKTIDDRTGKVRSLVAIWEEDGTLYGKIERLIDPDPNYPNPQCIYCNGALKDKPVIGLRIIWDLRKNGDQWSGGKVLDPENGKSYRCIIAMQDSGKTLKVRGYIGFSLFGRTQYWLRDQ